MKGIDISTYQQNVNYKKLKEQGIEFAIIRLGYGKNISQKDRMFETHFEGLKNAGIKVGAYLYSYAYVKEGAKLEAENTLEIIKGKHMPKFIKLVFAATEELKEKISPDSSVLFLNITFENNAVTVITGSSTKTFTMDKSGEYAWDEYVNEFFEKNNIAVSTQM